MRLRHLSATAAALIMGLAAASCFRSTPDTVPTPPPNLPSAPNNSMGGPATGGVPRPGGMMSGPGGNMPRPGGSMGGVPGPNTNVTGPPAGAKVVGGGSFNKLFPNDQDGFNRVFTQEKKGFAEALLRKGGKKIALLSISDIAANPSAISKYQTSSQMIAGFPAAPVGSQGTAILVGNRYQVQARSVDASFTAADREAWLGKFNLSGLNSLK